MITANEKGLTEKIELVPTVVNPFGPSMSATAINPLGKIPALVLNDGEALYGSTVICEYLDALDGIPRLFPVGAARWLALRRNALADGMLEAGIAVRLEGLRPVENRWPTWRETQLLKVANALDTFEREAEGLPSDTLTIGEVALICGLGWLDFRIPELFWRDSRPSLARWFADVSWRHEVSQTAPREQSI